MYILVMSRVTSQTRRLVTRLDFFYDSSQMVSDSEKVELLESISRIWAAAVAAADQDQEEEDEDAQEVKV